MMKGKQNFPLIRGPFIINHRLFPPIQNGRQNLLALRATAPSARTVWYQNGDMLTIQRCLIISSSKIVKMSWKGRKSKSKYTYGNVMQGKGNVWYQTTVTLDPKPRGHSCYAYCSRGNEDSEYFAF